MFIKLWCALIFKVHSSTGSRIDVCGSKVTKCEKFKWWWVEMLDSDIRRTSDRSEVKIIWVKSASVVFASYPWKHPNKGGKAILLPLLLFGGNCATLSCHREECYLSWWKSASDWGKKQPARLTVTLPCWWCRPLLSCYIVSQLRVIFSPLFSTRLSDFIGSPPPPHHLSMCRLFSLCLNFYFFLIFEPFLCLTLSSLLQKLLSLLSFNSSQE